MTDTLQAALPPPCVQNGKFAIALKRLWPHGDSVVKGLLDGMIASAPTAFPKWGFTADLLVCHAMGEFSEESGAGTELVENMNYSAARLLEVFPTHFNYNQAIELAHQPRLIADQAYDGRNGNRIGTDDGWNFRGQGLSQVTGRDNVAKLSKLTGLDLVGHPEWIISPEHALEVALADFSMCSCLPYARRDSVLGVASMLNCGHFVAEPSKINGYAMRANWTSLWKHALGVS